MFTVAEKLLVFELLECCNDSDIYVMVLVIFVW